MKIKKDANEYLFNEAIKYLGKYPATQKKIKEYLQKKSKIKRPMHERFSLRGLIKKTSLIK